MAKTLKRRIRKHKTNVGEKAQQLLDEKVKRNEREELAKAIAEMKAILSKIPDEEITRSIRRSRDQDEVSVETSLAEVQRKMRGRLPARDELEGKADRLLFKEAEITKKHHNTRQQK